MSTNPEHLLDPEVHPTRVSVASLQAVRPSALSLVRSGDSVWLRITDQVNVFPDTVNDAGAHADLTRLREILAHGVDLVDAELAKLDRPPADDLAEVNAALDDTGDPDVDEMPPLEVLDAPECTGIPYLVNVDSPDGGVKFAHDDPCPVHGDVHEVTG